jgi:hypothetical protein
LIENCDYGPTEIIKMMEFVVNNTFFTLGKSLYKQVHGIPMGTDCAPQLANLFLHSLEHKFIMKNIKRKSQIIRSLNLTFRYIDDLTVINGSDIMDNVKKEIYPPYLNLIRINNDLNMADVLDLNIEINNKKFYTKLFDKRVNLPFKTICFPHLDSNLPVQMCQNVFAGQILRYAIINTEHQDFKKCTKNLIKYLDERGYTRNKLLRITYNTIKKHKFISKKFKITLNRNYIKDYG